PAAGPGAAHGPDRAGDPGARGAQGRRRGDRGHALLHDHAWRREAELGRRHLLHAGRLPGAAPDAGGVPVADEEKAQRSGVTDRIRHPEDRSVPPIRRISLQAASGSGQHTVSQGAFDRLLDKLGPDREAAAREYERLHCRLVDFFEGRNAPTPEELADETLDRVARKLEQGEPVEHLRAYAYGVAKLVCLEAHRRKQREQAALEELPATLTSAAGPQTEERVAALQQCLAALPEESRRMIVRYYEGSGSPVGTRKALADRLGLSYATLKTRTYR